MGTQHSCTVGGMRWGLGGRKGSASAYHASPSINIILRLLTAYVQPFPVIFFPQNQNCLEIGLADGFTISCPRVLSRWHRTQSGPYRA